MTIVALHFLQRILTTLPRTFSSAIVYLAWQDWHWIFIAVPSFADAAAFVHPLTAWRVCSRRIRQFELHGEYSGRRSEQSSYPPSEFDSEKGIGIGNDDSPSLIGRATSAEGLVVSRDMPPVAAVAAGGATCVSWTGEWERSSTQFSSTSWVPSLPQ